MLAIKKTQLVLALISLLIFPLFLSATPAEQRIELIELQHRDANNLIPILKPFLSTTDRISGTGNQLILKTSADTLAQIKKILEKLDQRLRRLLVTVKYARETQQSQNTVDLSGHVKISKNKPQGALSPQKAISPQGTISANARITHTRSDEDRYSTQQLQVAEGHWATFNIGQLISVTQTKLNVSGTNTTLQTSTEYKKTGSGFRVLPTIRNNLVILKIASYYSKQNTVDNRNIDNLSAQTEVTGKPGTWINLGGTSTITNHDPRTKTYSTRKNYADNRRIWVKVDMLSSE